ncbi:MAG: hypothetical protein ACO3NK_20835 [Prochlorotrichaceae cyanobacterium]
MSAQPKAPAGTTLPQDRTQEQLSSPTTGGEPNLWLQSLMLHAPAIGLGLGIATGLCLLMGISLRILLNPNIHALTDPEPAAVSSRGEEVPNPTIQETDESGVRIIFPATKSFLVEADSTAPPLFPQENDRPACRHWRSGVGHNRFPLFAIDSAANDRSLNPNVLQCDRFTLSAQRFSPP